MVPSPSSFIPTNEGMSTDSVLPLGTLTGNEQSWYNTLLYSNYFSWQCSNAMDYILNICNLITVTNVNKIVT